MNGAMGAHTRAGGPTTKCTASAHLSGPMANATKESTFRIRSTAMAPSIGKLKVFMSVTLFVLGRTATDTKASGKKGNNMVRASLRETISNRTTGGKMASASENCNEQQKIAT